MKNIYKILGVCLFMLASIQNVAGQFGPVKGGATVTINGPTNSFVGGSETYTITPSAGLTITAAAWTVIGGGGTIQSQNNTSATINWTSSGTHSIKYQVTASNQGALLDTHDVTVTFLLVVPPPTPNVTNVTCNSATLVATGTIPSGDSWYWQGTNATGTSTANPSTSNYVANSSGTYYIRARNNGSGVWSPATSVSVALITPTWYQDLDGDGLGDPNVSVTQCTQPVNYVANSNDQCPNEHGGGSSTGCAVPVNLSNENYVYTIAPQVAVTNTNQLSNNADAIKNVMYLDGLGRPMQQVAIKQSATGKDIVTHFTYDAVTGIQSREYLPYASLNSTGAYESNDPEGKTKTYYKTNYADDFVGIPTANINPYSEKELEASPLNRVFKQAAPGEDWKLGNGHEIEFEYSANHSTEVRLYSVSLSSTYVPTLTGGTSYYAAGELTKMITKDENHTSGNDRTTEEFTNSQGQMILKRAYDNNQAHDTYYVYDDFGNLSFVLPPKSEANNGIPSSSALVALCYKYQYDKKNRLAQKRLPGKDWEYIVYDQLDRPIMTQDANQKPQRKWLFTKYDQLGRVAYTGLYTHWSQYNQAQMQNYIDANNDLPSELYESRVTSGTGVQGSYYENNNFPTSNIEVYTINYYDDYNFNLAGSLPPAGINFSYAVSGTPDRITTRTQGLATGTKVKVLGQAKWITSVNYYDHRGRPVYGYSKNEYLNTIDVVQTELDFAGKVVETTSSHTKTDNTQATITTIDMFSYDHAGRLLMQSQKIGNNPVEVIVGNTYNELGQILNKRVGGLTTDADGLQTVDYTRNVRGWLTNINDVDNIGSDLFTFKLNYNKPIEGSGGGNALYNGNIGQSIWKTANDNMKRSYSYDYDALNRLEVAYSRKGSTLSSIDEYSVWMNYDKNGNITRLNRKGHTNSTATSFGVMDDLYYTYLPNSNQLSIVRDDAPLDEFGFKDDVLNQGPDTTADYSYDANGNMLSDTNKGIASISYNHLNLPVSITFSNGGHIAYKYDANGAKLSKEIETPSEDPVFTYYAGNFIYKALEGEDSELQFFGHPEGYVKYENGNFEYVYQYKDHLGNVRLTYTDANNDGSITSSSEIVEESNYYPFGLNHIGYNNVVSANGNSTAQKFKYNGEELEESLELNVTEMIFRQYDNATGRFISIDYMAEESYDLTPYRFGFNNPVLFNDPTGLYEEKEDRYRTSDPDEIEALLNFIKENKKSKNGKQIEEFIMAEIEFNREVNDPTSLRLSTVVVKMGGKIDKYQEIRMKNEIAFYEGKTNYLYSKSDLAMRNFVFRDPRTKWLKNTIISLENRGNYQPLTRSGYISYWGGPKMAHLRNWVASVDQFADVFPNYGAAPRPSGSRFFGFGRSNSHYKSTKGSLNSSSNTGSLVRKNISFKEFRAKYGHLFRGKFKGRGQYQKQVALIWRRIRAGLD